MKSNKLKLLLLVGCLLALTCAAMVYAGKGNHFRLWSPPVKPANNGIVTLSGNLSQNNVLLGGNGMAGLSLTITAAEALYPDQGEVRNVDMVIVLDRSGSMGGEKIADARQAALNLLSNLSAEDRFGLVTYSDGAQRQSNLVKATPANRERLRSIISSISVGGATNLGAGLQEGINVLLSAQENGNARKVIIISDGLANRGITEAVSLGNIASISVEKEFAVSTVGVGTDFNEHLMTYIADRGAGNYYYLENPNTFAEVFRKEFNIARRVVAAAVEIRIPLTDGVSVVDASGYPVDIKNNQALIHPGDLLSGQSRKLFLTLQVPTHKKQTYEINGISAHYRHEGQSFTAFLAQSLQIACVKNQQEVFSSIDKNEWEEKVLKEDLNRLREEVAVDIKTGRKAEALKRIQGYYREQQTVNSVVGSGKVATSLERDLEDLREQVKDTFQGTPQAVQLKQKKNSKVLQYEGYKGRRSSK